MLPQLKAVMIAASSATNAGTATLGPIDLLGSDWATIDILGTTQSASTQAGSPSVLKLQESDTTAATSFVDIVGARGASATATNVDFVVGVGLTAGVNGYKFNVDGRARKRYLQAVISPTTTQTFSATANLGRMEQAPVTALKAGVISLIEI